ncbi:MAG: glycosyltransferase family 39 protein [Candidatus Microgenomates bacterium]|jgi:hypothetical protein
MRKYNLILVGVLILHLFLLFHFQFTAWPEMLLWPYLMIHGWLPYLNIAIPHTPLLLVKLFVFYKIFGVGINQLKIFTWLSILVLDFLVFWIGKKLWNVKTALIALATFAFWQIFFDGNGLWFDLFMGLIVLISYYFVQKKNYFWAGFFWILAFLTKQTAVFFLIPIGLEILRDKKTIIKNGEKFILGILIILVPFILILWAFGILPAFIDWGIKFGIFVLPKATGQIQLPDLKTLFVSLLPFSIFIPVLFYKKTRNIYLFVWSIVGIFGAYPRFEYFHFQPAIPFLGLATGFVVSHYDKKNRLIKSFLTIYLIGSLILFAGFFIRNWNEGTRFFETDVSDVAAYVKANSKPGDTIFVMNWWDNIYALTNTLPPTNPWVPQLSWYTEMPGIQEKMVQGLSETKPEMVLLQPYSDIGLSSYIPEDDFNYVQKNYVLKTTVDDIEIFVPK